MFFRAIKAAPIVGGLVATVSTSKSAVDDRFGHAVTLIGDTLAVGAPLTDTSENDAGAVYLFSRHQGGINRWGQIARFLLSSPREGDQFGTAIAMDNGFVVIGAQFKDDIGTNAGIAYVFARSQSGNWQLSAALSADDTGAGDHFGSAIALAENALLFGVAADSVVGVNAGAAYAFVKSGTSWTQQIKLKMTDAGRYDAFGHAVAVNKNLAAVGVPQDDDLGSDTGSVYLFQRNYDQAEHWQHVTKIHAADASVGDQFGNSVALSDNTLAVGAAFADDAGTDSGAVYVFRRDNEKSDSWHQVAKLIANDAQTADFFR